MAIFSFIEGWYNPRRRHSGLGYLSPVDYEEAHAERPNPPASPASNRCSNEFQADAAVKDTPAARRFAVFDP